MKTAMQELIDIISAMEMDGRIQKYKSTETQIMFYHDLKKLLQKEKEQIITAFEVGYKSCDIDEAFEINRKLASGELHYNKTYNQNK